MTLAPLLNAVPPISFHAMAAIGAFVLGVGQLALPKGDLRHRVTGFAWVALMIFVALSSFWINTIRLIGPFSPIHLLSILTLVAVPRAVFLARKGDIAGHRRLMLILFWAALVGAGAFTLIPGRIMHAVAFG